MKYSPQPLIVSGSYLKKSSLNDVSTLDASITGFVVSVLLESIFCELPVFVSLLEQLVKIKNARKIRVILVITF